MGKKSAAGKTHKHYRNSVFDLFLQLIFFTDYLLQFRVMHEVRHPENALDDLGGGNKWENEEKNDLWRRFYADMSFKPRSPSGARRERLHSTD